jgi:hypothetical protein
MSADPLLAHAVAVVAKATSLPDIEECAFGGVVISARRGTAAKGDAAEVGRRDRFTRPVRAPMPNAAIPHVQ